MVEGDELFKIVRTSWKKADLSEKVDRPSREV